jgi:tryptophanyl-tRNA synthetase
LLKVDKTETVLLDIRQTKLTCEEAKAKVLKEVEETFARITKKLKERKNVITQQIEDHFNEQLDSIHEQEQKWLISYESFYN